MCQVVEQRRFMLRFQLSTALQVGSCLPGIVASTKAMNRAGKFLETLRKDFPALFIALMLATNPGESLGKRSK